jgi:hypothetical protein
VLDWTLDNLSAEDVARLRSIYEPLTESVRALIDATIRAEVGAETVAAVKAEIDAATARLRSEQLDGPYGIRFSADGDRMPWGNVMIGVRNPVAPPLVVEQSAGGSAFADFHLGAAYEGPPGNVHGGVRLGNLHAEAWIARTEGVKTYAVGHLADEEGVTVEAEGVFIRPRWARD